MKTFILKTFGGLDKQCYIRHFLFGLMIPAIFIIISLNSERHMFNFSSISFFIVNSFLYPYSRFVYEGIVEYITGRNIFIVNAIIALIFKLFTIAMCWGYAFIIAPVGLLYLYCYHSKQMKLGATAAPLEGD